MVDIQKGESTTKITVQSANTFYKLAKDWAIKMNGAVEGLDYSSKYYASQALNSATTAVNAKNSILNDAGFIAVSNDLENINTVADNMPAVIAAPAYASSASASASTATSQANIATAQALLAKQYAEETHGQSDVMVENVRAIPAYTNYEYQQIETKGLADLQEMKLKSVKTGIDQIKADDYTVVGSPTITDDGVASGFSSSSYLKSPQYEYANAYNIKIEGIFSTNDLSSVEHSEHIFVLYGGGTNNMVQTYYNTSKKMNIKVNTGSGAKTLKDDTYVIESNSIYEFVFEFNVQNSNLNFKIRNNSKQESWYSFPSETMSSFFTSTLMYVAFGTAPWDTSTFLTGSIDLNSFKIYVDGNLVYQPTLRIPYNQSKTGSKIVNAVYRDRVQDMYEQFGWANYYTLSDSDFTVPYGENLDGHVTKIDWYKNGVTSWEYDTNLDCIETGSCTNGTAVTLPKPMADANYTLSVPYSAKTKTGFTPSASGDYIAKGKVVLG